MYIQNVALLDLILVCISKCYINNNNHNESTHEMHAFILYIFLCAFHLLLLFIQYLKMQTKIRIKPLSL